MSKHQAIPKKGAKQQGAKQQGAKQHGAKQQGAKQQGAKQQGAKQQGAKQKGAKQKEVVVPDKIVNPLTGRSITVTSNPRSVFMKLLGDSKTRKTLLFEHQRWLPIWLGRNAAAGAFRPGYTDAEGKEEKKEEEKRDAVRDFELTHGTTALLEIEEREGKFRPVLASVVSSVVGRNSVKLEGVQFDYNHDTNLWTPRKSFHDMTGPFYITWHETPQDIAAALGRSRASTGRRPTYNSRLKRRYP